jgi:opacity protein-like surface antigen
MKIGKFAATSALVIAAMTTAMGTSYADPAPAPAPVGWNVTQSGNQVIVDTTAGSLSNEDNHLVVRDASGALVDSVPLSLAVDGFAHPVAADIDGNHAVLTADVTPAAATPVSTQLPGLQQVDLPAAVAGVKDNLSLSASVGGFLGAATGLVGGCLLGALAGGVVSAPAALLFGAGPIAGCIGGALLLGSTASLAGTAVGGLGAIAANAQQFITLLNAPPAKK